ncbi:MAG: hypothetical protein JWQ69_5243 [Pseudomonas sp.]|nr:hypothetical protein [Pseudomonas sp.]
MERPILFSPPMVNAILNGKKTVTRRIVKSPDRMSGAGHGTSNSASDAPSAEASTQAAHEFTQETCPYGQPGDRLWLKEAFYAFGHWENRFNEQHQREEWHFIDQTHPSGHDYQFTEPAGYVKKPRTDSHPAWWLRASLFMPRRASRIDLEIVDVHMERLRDITDEQAQAEGFSPLHDGMHGYYLNHLPPPHVGISVTAVIAFAVFWQSLNGAES